jgi:putative transposase
VIAAVDFTTLEVWTRSGLVTILFGEQALRNAVNQYLAHYHNDRCHQGLDNELIVPLDRPPDMNAKIETIERLGGLLRSYRRAA